MPTDRSFLHTMPPLALRRYDMPYLFLRFQDAVDASMRETASKIAEGSAFKPNPVFRVSLMGSLHQYDAKYIESVRTDALVAYPSPSFHFIRWELTGETLRCLIGSTELSSLASCLHQALPLGRPWAAFYVTLGSVASISGDLRDDFLAAVSSAFPVDEHIKFTLKGPIEYSCEPPPKRCGSKDPPYQSRTHVSALGAGRPQGHWPARSNKLPIKLSPHKKWDRGESSLLDQPCMLMDTTDTTRTVVQHGGISKRSSRAATRRDRRQGGRGRGW